MEGQSGRMEYDDEWVEEDEREPLDRHTMKILVRIANSIKADLNFTGDCCSNNEDGYIPVLDMKMKTVLVTETAEGRPPVSYYQTTFKFYKKPMARKSVMNANTAMADKIKRETMSNEATRRMTNTLPFMPNSEDDVVEALSEFAREMKTSGYKESYRRDTLENMITGFKRQLLKTGDPSGGKVYPGDVSFQSRQGVDLTCCPPQETLEEIENRIMGETTCNLYRDWSEGARERHNKKITEKSGWFKKKIMEGVEEEENQGGEVTEEMEKVSE